MVQLTVNEDDPTSYGIYYCDELGRPGTLLTFFHWPDIPKGYRETSEVTVTSFSTTENLLDYWTSKFEDKQIEFKGPYKRFADEQVLTFYDPDGLELEIVAHKSAEDNDLNVWKEGPVPVEQAIRGFHSVTLSEEGYEFTASVLVKELGFTPTFQDGSRYGFEISSKNGNNIDDKEDDLIRANIVDIVCLPYTQRSMTGIGSVHHVAWRTPSDQQQLALRNKIVGIGLNLTPVIDRVYFHSVYFREPGGVLFEVATNPPGLTVDENSESLGTHLTLAPWLEPIRHEVEKVLPKVQLPKK